MGLMQSEMLTSLSATDKMAVLLAVLRKSHTTGEK